MNLPIDPSQLTREDIGERRLTLNMGHDEAVEHVRRVFEEAGFGIPVEFSPAELLREKLGADRDPYYVLGACNPEMADRALDVTNDIGALFPCNVIVHEVEPGVQEVYHVSIMKIARLVGMAPDDEDWEAIVADTSKLVERAFADLESSESEVETDPEKPRGGQGGKREGRGQAPGSETGGSE